MRIHHIAITVKNLEESKLFYQNNFGFTVTQSFERPDLTGKATLMKLDESLIELWEFKDSKDTQDSLKNIKLIGLRHFAIGVDDIDAAVKNIRANGQVLDNPQQGASGHRYTFLTDPSGIPIELFEK